MWNIRIMRGNRLQGTHDDWLIPVDKLGVSHLAIDNDHD